MSETCKKKTSFVIGTATGRGGPGTGWRLVMGGDSKERKGGKAKRDAWP